MRRICLFALLTSALCVPALADPLTLNPNAYVAGAAQTAAAQPAASAPSAAPVRLAAAQPELGGGFIQFLFNGGQQSPAATGAGSSVQQATALADEPASSEPGAAGEADHPPLDPKFDRQVVAYDGKQKPGTIVVDTKDKFLYLVEAGGKAMRYGIGVGRKGFTWKGTETITAKRKWPDWRPPVEMVKRQPELPRFMAGGPDNPLGARALYLGSTDYRIHGSNEPWTIGHSVSSGCIRLRNADIEDLYSRVKVGTKVVVM